jgi:outer membrane protein OmpA-like peptidoglycan-associated protein
MFRGKIVLAAAAAAALLAGCTTYDDAAYSGRHYRYGPPPWARTQNGAEIDYEFLDEVLFAYDSADLSPRARDAIWDVADEISRHHRHWTVEVDGYTDTVGSQDYNMPLSQARAQSVADTLVRYGIDPHRIAVHGYGKTHLAVKTGDNVRERRNRRVVIRLIPPPRR